MLTSLSDLLLSILRVAKKACDVARTIRSEHALLHLLVEEKKGVEKNERFVQDFKTLADVLIQQMVSHDIVQQFPEMKDSIFGEESNQFTNTLGETKTICLCATSDETKQLLMEILDDNEEAATILAEIVHRQAATHLDIDKLDKLKSVEISSSDIGIWIDPIDSTAQYIKGTVGVLDENGVTENGGLQCVVVLIGAFQKSTGLPIVGVAVQPFWELDPETQQWSDQTTWGVCCGDVQMASVDKSPNSFKRPVIVMSTSEADPVKQTLSKFHVRFAHGAGYKLLCTAQLRVDAYVLSKNTVYLWDCCAPHAILRATGGGVVCFHDALVGARGLQHGNLSASELKEYEVSYLPSTSQSDGTGKNINGIIAYSCSEVLEQIVKSLIK